MAYFSANPNAMQRLEKLRTLRMRGQAPVGALMVVTERLDLELCESIKRPVIEVWKRDLGKLDWGPIAGLWVFCLVRNWPHELRLQLCDSLRAAEPKWLDWLATARTDRHPSEVVGQMRIHDGEPQVMEDPLILSQFFGRDFWDHAEPDQKQDRLTKAWQTYGRI